MGPGALGLSGEEIRGSGGRRGCHPAGSPGARRGWLEAGLQRKIGWTGTTLRVGYAEAEES